jgi:hypothetical protein
MSDTKKKAQSTWITKDRDEGRCAFQSRHPGRPHLDQISRHLCRHGHVIVIIVVVVAAVVIIVIVIVIVTVIVVVIDPCPNGRR